MILTKEQPFTTLSVDAIAALKREAATSPRQRARILMHDGHDDPMQEMLIALGKHSYIMPHRQIDRVKTYIVLEGHLLLVFFEENGDVRSTQKLGAGIDTTAIIRFHTNTWHTAIALTDPCLYLEIAQGPFEGSQWADWAPNQETSAEASAFIERLRVLAA